MLGARRKGEIWVQESGPEGSSLLDCWNMGFAFYTIGHSTHEVTEFVDLLKGEQIGLVVDVRTVPRSRSNPQFNGDVLAQTLAQDQIGYERIAALGGLRGKQREVAPGVNAFWQNQSFHNYADYSLTEAFHSGLARLRALGQEKRCAIMCAEAVWWRCHRRIIADYLLAAGETVLHILGQGRIEPARMTAAARLGLDGSLTYPAADLADAALASRL
jgi:uncharacterized protein (DUF488 family)